MKPLEGPVRIVVQSELIANEQLPPASDDPRVPGALTSSLEQEYQSARDRRCHP